MFLALVAENQPHSTPSLLHHLSFLDDIITLKTHSGEKKTEQETGNKKQKKKTTSLLSCIIFPFLIITVETIAANVILHLLGKAI